MVRTCKDIQNTLAGGTKKWFKLSSELNTCWGALRRQRRGYPPVISHNYTVVKVDCATPKRWLSKGPWSTNAWELRHLLGGIYIHTIDGHQFTCRLSRLWTVWVWRFCVSYISQDVFVLAMLDWEVVGTYRKPMETFSLKQTQGFVLLVFWEGTHWTSFPYIIHLHCAATNRWVSRWRHGLR